MNIKRALLAFLLVLAGSSAAQAHLMVAQQGALNFVNDGVYMVLSLPVSAFTDIDDDGDGKMSGDEFIEHRAVISETIKRQVIMSDQQGDLPLTGLLISPTLLDNAPAEPSTQLVAVGKFNVNQGAESLRFTNRLFGTAESEKTFQITVSDKVAERKQLILLNSHANSAQLFPSLMSVFVNYIKLGTEHIITGVDHLLFLLLVLAAGWHWRHVLLMLTTFTIGHAITLALSVFGGLSLPSSIVEPAIAVTILVMIVFDFISARRHKPLSTSVRLAVVFLCALIHGLGLATAFTDFGLDSQHQLTSLAGFNVGIELGQVGVALVAALLVYMGRPLWRKLATPLRVAN